MKKIKVLSKTIIKKWYEQEYSHGLDKSIYGKPKKQLLSFFKILEKNNVNSVIELGCGGGRNLFELAKRGFKVTGVDIVGENVIEKTTKNKKLLIRFIKSDITRFNFQEKYDAIICSEVFHLIERKYFRKIIMNIKSALNSDGFVYIDVLTNLRRVLVKTKEQFRFEDQPDYTDVEIVDLLKKHFNSWKTIELEKFHEKQTWPISKRKHPINQYNWYGDYVYLIAQKREARRPATERPSDSSIVSLPRPPLGRRN